MFAVNRLLITALFNYIYFEIIIRENNVFTICFKCTLKAAKIYGDSLEDNHFTLLMQIFLILCIILFLLVKI